MTTAVEYLSAAALLYLASLELRVRAQRPAQTTSMEVEG